MKMIKISFGMAGIFLLLLHGVSIFFDIKNFYFRFSSFHFSLEDNINGIYSGFILLIFALLFEIIEKKYDK